MYVCMYNPLHPPEGEDRQYGQLYIIEGDQAVTSRINAPQNNAYRPDAMTGL